MGGPTCSIPMIMLLIYWTLQYIADPSSQGPEQLSSSPHTVISTFYTSNKHFPRMHLFFI